MLLYIHPLFASDSACGEMSLYNIFHSFSRLSAFRNFDVEMPFVAVSSMELF